MLYNWTSSLLPLRRAFSTQPLSSIRRKVAPSKRAKGPLEVSDERTYQEELYSARRVELITPTTRMPVSAGLSRIFDTIQSEGVLTKVRSKREFVKPGKVASLERMKRRQERFNKMVHKTISDINQIYRRLD